MAKTKTPLPSEEVTADEVEGWFPESKFGDPDKAHVKKLARAIENTRLIKSLSNTDIELQKSSKTSAKIVLNIGSLIKLLDRLVTEAGPYADQDLKEKVSKAVEALEPFLRGPQKKRGSQAEWAKSALTWAQLVAGCLTKTGKPPPSTKTADGPVMAVLQKAISRIYEPKTADQISAALKAKTPSTEQRCYQRRYGTGAASRARAPSAR